jgi:hypothetical protein
MFPRRIVGWVALISVLVSSANWLRAEEAESDSATAEAVDPSGSWHWEYTFDDNTAEFSLDLNWDGEKLTGTYTAFGNTTDIEETELAKDAVSFLSRREFNGNPFTVKFRGTVQPDDIVGTVSVDIRGEPREFDWHAKRKVELDDVVGVWKLHLETPQGPIEPQLTITREGDELRGHYVSPFGEREPKDLTLKDNELSWRLVSDEDDQFDFEIQYRGKPRGNKISGTNEFDFGGNTGTMDFTGTRTPPEDKTGQQSATAQDAGAATSEASANPAPPADDSP